MCRVREWHAGFEGPFGTAESAGDLCVGSRPDKFFLGERVHVSEGSAVEARNDLDDSANRPAIAPGKPEKPEQDRLYLAVKRDAELPRSSRTKK